MNLLDTFKQFVREENLFQPKDRLLLAVSGGVDSVVLCALCKKAGFQFAIAHCNFKLRGEESNRDEQFVQALAKSYGVPFFIERFDTASYARLVKKSVEEAARDLRYEWFFGLLDTGMMEETKQQIPGAAPGSAFVLTAHHADDNIETVLMNFFRGTGITGLRGILPKQGRLVRPLLFARRTELENFVRENGLEYVTDQTNLQNDYTRNYFRNAIIPLVSERLPEAAGNVLKNIRRFRDTEILYQQSIQLHCKKLLEKKGNEVHIPVLKLKKTIPLATVLFEIIRQYGFTAHQTGDVLSLMDSESGKYIQSATYRIIKNRNWLIISPREPRGAAHILIEATDRHIVFSTGALSIEVVGKAGFTMISDAAVALLDLDMIRFPLLLRKWKQGDYFYPLGMQKKKKLSRFFIDQKLSLSQKENVMVIEMDKKIIWVVGMRIDDRFKIRDSTKQICVLRSLSGTGN